MAGGSGCPASTLRLVRRDKGFMNTPAELTQAPPLTAAEVTAGEVEQVERALIDASTRLPVLVFYTSAIAWLLIGTLLAALASLKMHSPDLLSNVAFLTFGRVRAAHMSMSVYGWASMAGMGTAIWLMHRL